MFIGYDPGYGNTKISINGATATLQSVAVRPNAIGMASIGMKRGRAACQVSILNGVSRSVYAVGDGAWLQGEPIGGMDFSALASEARRALFYAAVSDVLQPGEYEADLVVGLPVPLLEKEEQARAVLADLRAGYKTCHEWQASRQAGGATYRLQVNRLSVLAQPVGAYADWLIDEDLHTRKGAAAAEVAVLDIGMNTVDLYVVQDKRVSQRFVGGATIGVRRLLASMNDHGHDLEEIDHNLRTGAIRPEPLALRAWMGQILSQIERTWPSLNRFDAVIPVGGGAVILGDLLREALIDRGAAIAWPADPISTNARGFWKIAASAAARK